MLALGVDVFDIVSGVVGTLAVLITTYRWLLPARRFAELDVVIGDVEYLLDATREEGALEPMLAMSASECLLRSVPILS
jgi:hypothetical protein